MASKHNILLVQLGSPKTSKVSDVRSYLKEFLSDPRVVDLPRFFWMIILYCFILTFRPKKSAAAYKRIEFCGFFPLIELTKKFREKLSLRLGKNSNVKECFILSEPRIEETTKDLQSFVYLPQFPQFSDTTTSSCTDRLARVHPDWKENDKIKFIPQYHLLKAFIDLSAKQIENQIKKYPADFVIISFHGIPVRYVTQKGDPYYRQCCETFTMIKEQLNFDKDKIFMTFQSRLGSEQWLNPYTDEFATKLAHEKQGAKIAVYCPSFVCDCLETIDEIGNELQEEVEEHGGELIFVPCLNVQDEWVDAYANMIELYCEEKNDEYETLFYKPEEHKVKENMPELKQASKAFTPEQKSTVKVIFLTLFLDLIGFSIIFPMFPALAKHYLEVDPDNFFLKLIFSSINVFTEAGSAQIGAVVLFGGALGALYSILQFFAAPLWGGLSDKYGRKPILMISVFGLFLSYVLWFFSGSFTVLILARFIGGIMGGNISVATAVITDITDKSNRSKGMAFVGIAFALGFIFGPALGGLLTLYNPLDYFPQLSVVGVNPFSAAAALAALLSLINLFILKKNFKETLKSNTTEGHKRSANIFALFKPLPIREVTLTNYAYFLFISAFSGMEFTLTFLAVERLSYSSLDNAYMFIFIGVIIALVQGGFVRRKAGEIGEKKVAIMGLSFLVPGLVLIGFTTSSFMLYAGLFFLSVGSAMAIPTLTSLVSFFTPADLQGKSMGIFRSLGALGRVIGPIGASLIYWRFGGATPYLLGAAFLILPILLIAQIKQEPQNNETI